MGGLLQSLGSLFSLPGGQRTRGMLPSLELCPRPAAGLRLSPDAFAKLYGMRYRSRKSALLIDDRRGSTSFDALER